MKEYTSNDIKHIMIEKGYRNLFQTESYAEFVPCKELPDIIVSHQLCYIINDIRQNDKDFVFPSGHIILTEDMITNEECIQFFLTTEGIIKYEYENKIKIFTPIITEIINYIISVNNGDKTNISQSDIILHLQSKNISMHLFNIKNLLDSCLYLLIENLTYKCGYFFVTKTEEKKSFFSKNGEAFIEKYMTLKENRSYYRYYYIKP